MKKLFVTILFASVLLPLSMLFLSCSAATTYDKIFKPEVSYRSPELDFTKVTAMAILPVNCTSDEVPELTSAIDQGLAFELKRAQKAWQVFGTDDVLRTLNEKNLGRGYQNYIADLNTFASVAGHTPNFTLETKTFFNQLKKEMNIGAILFTSYGFSEIQETEYSFTNKLLGGSGNVLKTSYKLTVTVILYEISNARAWWVSRLTLKGSERFPIAELGRKVVEGIANNFGKGTLRQL